MATQRERKAGRTPDDLIDAADNGARIAARLSLARGGDEESTRRGVIAWFRREIEEESFGPFADERLMAAVQGGVEAVLAEYRSRPAAPSRDEALEATGGPTAGRGGWTP